MATSVYRNLADFICHYKPLWIHYKPSQSRYKSFKIEMTCKGAITSFSDGQLSKGLKLHSLTKQITHQEEIVEM